MISSNGVIASEAKQSRAARDCFASAYALRASADSNPPEARAASEGGSLAMTMQATQRVLPPKSPQTRQTTASPGSRPLLNPSRAFDD
jgi:hypothetical protein